MVPGSATWIAKPSITNQALGICIFNNVDTLAEVRGDPRAEPCLEAGTSSSVQMPKKTFTPKP